MFVASTQKRIGRGSYRADYVISRDVFVATVRRTGLTFDSRFVPPPKAYPDGVLLYVLLQGALELNGERFDAPAAVCFDVRQFEGTVPFRNWGEPLAALEIRVDSTEHFLAGAPRPCSIELSDDSWASARRLARRPTNEGAVVELIRSLADQQLLAADLAHGLSETRSRHHRIFEAVRPFAERLDLLNTLDAVSLTAGLSLRHLNRELGEFARSFQVPFVGWRETTKRLRIKLAVLALSEPEVSIADIARLAGYGSTAAMKRAFHDAGIPAPSQVREMLFRKP